LTPEEARASLLKEHSWDPDTLALWIRAQARCEYCGRDMLANIDDYFYGTERDHLHPISLDGPDDLTNQALSCRMCNRLKRNYVFSDPSQDLVRAERIAAIAAFIVPKRAQRERDLLLVRPLLLAAAGRGA
jgi:HNH endonuclease